MREKIECKKKHSRFLQTTGANLNDNLHHTRQAKNLSGSVVFLPFAWQEGFFIPFLRMLRTLGYDSSYLDEGFNKRTLQMETVKFLQNIGSSRDCDVWMAQLSQHVNGIIFRESRNPSECFFRKGWEIKICRPDI